MSTCIFCNSMTSIFSSFGSLMSLLIDVHKEELPTKNMRASNNSCSLLMLDKYMCIRRKNIQNGKSCHIYFLLYELFLISTFSFVVYRTTKIEKHNVITQKPVFLHNSNRICILCLSLFIYSNILNHPFLYCCIFAKILQYKY